MRHQLTLPPDFWLSDCVGDDQHRVWLARDISPVGEIEMLIALMLNPSLARSEGVGDPTQRKMNGFASRLRAQRWGGANLFSRSTPYPEELFDFGYEDAVGPLNDAALYQVFTQAALRGWPVVAAWGSASGLRTHEKALMRGRVLQVIEMTQLCGIQLQCFHTTDDGTPRHPLMLGYEHATLKPWRA